MELSSLTPTHERRPVVDRTDGGVCAIRAVDFVLLRGRLDSRTGE